MFTDEDLDPVEFKSNWRKERYVKDNGCQTNEMVVAEVASQSTRRKHREVQTDELEDSFEVHDESTPELQEFVLKVGPGILKELQKVSQSHAFDDYTPNWREETNTISVVYTLSFEQDNASEKMQVTGLSWNSTGAVIAASFGRHDHEDWCTHKSILGTWNLDRRKLEPKKPDMSIDLQSCLMCIACHPSNPSWVAGGTFNGEVMVWDLSREDETLVASSGIGDDSHREPVSKVSWIADSDVKGRQKYNLISVSGDGKILIWKINRHKKTIRLHDGFILLTEALPQSMRMRAKSGDQEMGVTCVSYSPSDSTTFLIGSESGGIFRCSTETRGTPANSSVMSSVPLQSPVTFTFSPHHGPVYSVDCSPFHRNLFLTCGTDTSARIYSMLQTDPIITLEPDAGYLYSIKWSPVCPLVFAVGTETGQLLIFDLKHNSGVPKCKLDGSPSGKAVYTIQFNQKQDLLASGDGDGNICIWKLSDEITKPRSRENEILDEIANTALE